MVQTSLLVANPLQAWCCVLRERLRAGYGSIETQIWEDAPGSIRTNGRHVLPISVTSHVAFGAGTPLTRILSSMRFNSSWMVFGRMVQGDVYYFCGIT